MKRIASALSLILMLATIGRAQSNTVTVQVVAPPTWTISVAPSSYYQNKSATMSITVTAGTVTNACTASWDSTNLPLTFPTNLTNPVTLTAAVSTAMTATLGSHSVVLTCPLPTLTMNSPVTLPNARVGTAYSASLAALANPTGGVPPYSFSCSGLPTGLACSLSGVVSGVPSSAGSFSIDFTVTDATFVARTLARSIVGG